MPYGENIQVQCLTCKGGGNVLVSTPHPQDPGQCRVDPCQTCNGFGILIATELKRIEKWEPKKSI